jgi:hypothetical protein
MPDFIVYWLGERWLVSVKIGDIGKSKFVKDMFVQLFNELRDFREFLRGSDSAILLIYPDDIRKIEPEEEEIERAARETEVYAIVLRPQMEIRAPLPEVLKGVEETLRKKIPVSLSLKTVTSLLRAQVEEIMKEAGLQEVNLVKIIGEPELFFGINPVQVDPKKRGAVLRSVLLFLGTYIFISQALFLRLYYKRAPTILEGVDPRDITRDIARRLFNKVKDINYRPLFETF